VEIGAGEIFDKNSLFRFNAHAVPRLAAKEKRTIAGIIAIELATDVGV
jgi:hypothetical protein